LTQLLVTKEVALPNSPDATLFGLRAYSFLNKPGKKPGAKPGRNIGTKTAQDATQKTAQKIIALKAPG
jgi:hypothetical protein